MMNRRSLLLSIPAIVIGQSLSAEARTFYVPGLAEEAMDAGDVVLLDFWASWCSTCAAQERVIAELLAANPDYARHIRVIIVDWDSYGNGDLARSLQVQRRSTLVALKGRTEIGRIVAGTGRAEIEALMNAALAAATT
jgi:thiol-disulfide isomerase/thioredoxin